jgi:hypothetical protein
MNREQFAAIMTSDQFTPGEKFAAQAQYAPETFSSFGSALWNLLCAADQYNLERIALAFPDHVAALGVWRHGNLRQRFEAVRPLEVA